MQYQARSPFKPVETDIATLWNDGEWQCVLSWLGYRYRVRLMRGPALVREEIDLDEHVVLDVSGRWRAELSAQPA